MPPIGVQLVTLGCARNEVDSEELAARLEADDFALVDNVDDADVVVVNTCGFIAEAKKDSIDTILAAADVRADGTRPAVVAVGCLSQRYGKELADSLPEADAVLGFDDYVDISSRLRTILSGGKVAPPVPSDRRLLLPVTPVNRPATSMNVAIPGHSQTKVDFDDVETIKSAGAFGPGARVLRRRLDKAPYAPLKIASGCDRRCAFCAIPSFRGAYLSRPIEDLVAEASWLASQNAKELMLVSENSSSYGKDWAKPDALVDLLTQLNQVEGIDWLRVSYLQPAEIRPGLIETMVGLDKVVDYFDLSFQHASAAVLRKMRRFGDPDSFLGLINRIRQLSPEAGIRTNVIVGFPGESEADFETLKEFLTQAQLDVVGVFGYSDEEGTEAANLEGKLSDDEIAARRDELTDLVDQLCDQRAECRVGDRASVLVERICNPDEDDIFADFELAAGLPDSQVVFGRASFQGPEVDGCVKIVTDSSNAGKTSFSVGQIVNGTVIASEGVDLLVKADN